MPWGPASAGDSDVSVELALKWTETGAPALDNAKKGLKDLGDAAEKTHESLGGRLAGAFARLENRAPMMAMRQLRRAIDELLVSSLAVHGPLGRLAASFATLGLVGPGALGITAVAGAFGEMTRGTIEWTKALDVSLEKLNLIVAAIRPGAASQFRVSALAQVIGGDEFEKGSAADLLNKQVAPQQPGMFTRMGSRIQGGARDLGNWLYGMSVPDSIHWRPFDPGGGDAEQAFDTQTAASQESLKLWRQLMKKDDAEQRRRQLLAKLTEDFTSTYGFGEAVPGLDMSNARLAGLVNRQRFAAHFYRPSAVGIDEAALIDYRANLEQPTFGTKLGLGKQGLRTGAFGEQTPLGMGEFGAQIKAILDGLRTPVEMLQLQIDALKHAMEGAGVATAEQVKALHLMERRRDYLKSSQKYGNIEAGIGAGFGALSDFRDGPRGVLSGLGGLAQTASTLKDANDLPLLGQFAGPIGIGAAVLTGLASLFGGGKAKVTIDGYTEDAIRQMAKVRGDPLTTQYIVIPANDPRAQMYERSRLEALGAVVRG